MAATIVTGNYVSYEWAFGDRETGRGQDVSHVYPDPDVYIAEVTASNSVSEMTADTTVTIELPFTNLYLPLVIRDY